MIKQWVVGVTCAAMIGALAENLMSEGGPKRAGRLAVGLLMLLAVTKPLAGLDYDALAGALAEYSLADMGSYDAQLEEKNDAVLKEIIEARTAAYISDKAKTLGMDCSAEVTYHYGGDGDTWPEAVVVRGTFTDSQRAGLSRALEAELAISEEKQIFERVAEP